jgi:hypothetical protein
LEHCPFIDRFIPFNQLEADALCLRYLSWLPGVGAEGRVAKVVRKICQPFSRRQYATDLLLVPLRTPHYLYPIFVDFIPAGKKIGLDNTRPESNPLPTAAADGRFSATMNSGHLPADLPELEINQRFLEFLGCDLRGRALRPTFWTTQADRQFARELVKPDSRGIIIGLAPGVPTRTEKQLSPDWYAQLFRQLTDVPCQFIAFGTAVEKDYCQSVLQALAVLPQVYATQNLAGQTTVRQLVECVRLCDVWCGQETGSLHLAVALEKPVAGIVGGGHFKRFFPWGSAQLVHPIFNDQLDCFGCNWVCQHATLKCLHEISPVAAAAAVRAAVNSRELAHRPG